MIFTVSLTVFAFLEKLLPAIQFFGMNGYKNEWLLAVFVLLVGIKFIFFKRNKNMSNENEHFETFSELLPGQFLTPDHLSNSVSHGDRVAEATNGISSSEFITPTNLSIDLSSAELPFREELSVKQVRIQDTSVPRARCSRMIKRNYKKVRCRHVCSFGSEFCFVHKHAVEAEKTLAKIKALKEEQHVFNATEYEWKTCDECLNFLKALNIKDPEKYVPRGTCKNCKLFFRMVEHPEFK